MAVIRSQKPTVPRGCQEMKLIDLMNRYFGENPKTGYLVFEVYQESPIQGRVPIPNATVTISKQIGDGWYFAKVVKSDEDGKTEPNPTPTVDGILSETPDNGRAFATYNARVEAPGFQTKDFYDIQVFDGITTYQRAVLTPVI